MIQKKILAIILSLILISISCRKENSGEVNATIIDLTSVFGCRMIIVLDTGEKLEPVILPANTTLIANRRVAIKYTNVSVGTPCMSGTTIEITSLRYL
ncbi:MAG TPA: hypothetical protein VMY77_14005 [Chitinophagaceae bacterium]|nr:hypothetical protein [Chitinophagaceae bacterium]